MAKRTRVKVISHWPRAIEKLQEEDGRNALIATAAHIANRFQEGVEDEDVLDTSFYHDSIYINGQGVSSYEKTPKSGRYFGANHSGRWQKRVRLPKKRVTRHKNPTMIVRAAASYSYWLELEHNLLMKALMQSRSDLGDAQRIKMEPHFE